MAELSKEAKEFKKAKQRQWYKEHPGKATEYNNRYWEKKYRESLKQSGKSE